MFFFILWGFMSDWNMFDQFNTLRGEDLKIKKQPWADNDNGCLNEILTLIVCTFPLEPVVIYLENNQQLFQTHSMKIAFTHSLARAEKAVDFVSYNTVHEGTDIVLPLTSVH